MAYCTKQQLIDRFGEALLVAATDRAEIASGTIDDVAAERAITDADALIDGYLAGRYTLPLTSVPSLVTDLSLTVAIYRLHPGVAAQKITDDYRDALKQLAQISQGVIRLSVAGIEPSVSAESEVRMNDTARPMTNDSMKSWI